MSTVFAEREVVLAGEGPGFVRLYTPEPDGNSQACELHLSWPGFEQRQKVQGTDSWQCVLEAVRLAPLFISLTDDYKSGRLMLWDAPINAPPRRAPHNHNMLEAFFDVKPHPRDIQ